MLKSTKILLLTVSLVLVFTSISLGTFTPDLVQPPSISNEIIIEETTLVSAKITSLISTIGIIFSVFILLPICLVFGILYMVKSKASIAKKTTIGIIIILTPIIIFMICSILPVFSTFARL